MLGEAAEPALDLLSLPRDACTCIAQQLELDDRIRLAASCHTLRAASVDWFRNAVLKFDDEQEAGRAERLAWLCRVHAQVELEWWHGDPHTIRALTRGGARILKLATPDGPGLQLEQVPSELARLTELRTLQLPHIPLASATFEHLPQRLERLGLNDCRLQRLPAELLGLTRLVRLTVASNRGIQSGSWEHLPGQLLELDLHDCGLRGVPAPLATLTRLRELRLGGNPISGGWAHVPRQLLSLSLFRCSLRQIPAELKSLSALTELGLLYNRLEGGWEHVPTQQLRRLNATQCGLRQVPPELARCTLLRELSLTSNSINGGWQFLPCSLQQLSVSGCSQRRVPAELGTLTQLHTLKAHLNRFEGGWDSLPANLLSLNLGYCGLTHIPPLARLTRLTELHLMGTGIEGGWEHLPLQQLRSLSLERAPAEPQQLESLRSIERLYIRFAS